jgi:hypothetical protein
LFGPALPLALRPLHLPPTPLTSRQKKDFKKKKKKNWRIVDSKGKASEINIIISRKTMTKENVLIIALQVNWFY